jgi:hypothetical protein
VAVLQEVRCAGTKSSPLDQQRCSSALVPVDLALRAFRVSELTAARCNRLSPGGSRLRAGLASAVIGQASALGAAALQCARSEVRELLLARQMHSYGDHACAEAPQLSCGVFPRCKDERTFVVGQPTARWALNADAALLRPVLPL